MKRKVILESEEEKKAKSFIENGITAPDYLEIYHDKVKGRGVRSKKNFVAGEFVIFYNGKILSKSVPKKDDYIFELPKVNGKKLYIDGTADDGSLGRLINDRRDNPNLKVRGIYLNNIPIPTFFARTDIVAGEVLEYDYGGDSSGYWWRNKEFKEMVTKTQKVKKHDSGKKDVIIGKRTDPSVKFDKYLTLEAKVIKMGEELKHMKEEQMKEMKTNTRELEDRISTKFEALLEQGRKDREILIEFLQQQRKMVRETGLRKHLCEGEDESGKSSSSVKGSTPSPRYSVRELEIKVTKNCREREDEAIEKENSTEDMTIPAQFIPLDQKMQIGETEVKKHLCEEVESRKSSSSVGDFIPSPHYSVRDLEIEVRENCCEREDEAIEKENSTEDITIPAEFIHLDQQMQDENLGTCFTPFNVGETEVRKNLFLEVDSRNSSFVEGSIPSPQYSVRDLEIDVRENWREREDEAIEKENPTDIAIPAQLIFLDQKMKYNDSIEDSNVVSYLKEDLGNEEFTDMREMSASKRKIPSGESLSGPLRIYVETSSKSSVELEKQNEINIFSDKEKTTITLSCPKRGPKLNAHAITVESIKAN